MEEMKRVLLHVCCAPDGTIPVERLVARGFSPTLFFYGSNIHPGEEYAKRSESFLRLAKYYGLRYVMGPYEPFLWNDKAKDLATEPEGGARCDMCFRIQLYEAARVACLEKCEFLASTLTISPHKRPETVNTSGKSAAQNYGLVWIDTVWRKAGGFQESLSRSRELGLYRQNYCGCIYSIRRR